MSIECAIDVYTKARRWMCL